MTVQNRPVLGTIKCDMCKETATVHQAARGKGRFLYTRCPNCKCDQRTSAQVQTHIWDNTHWREGVEKQKPANIIDDLEKTKEPESQKAENAPNTDWNPNAKPKSKAETQKPNAPKSGAIFAVVGVVGLGVGAFALIKNKKPKQQQSTPRPRGGIYEPIN